ncbi:MAG: C39 family peptidase [Oscillospiraceae bacterium]|nr:C39 family peptidase [Oscillospiraceae bacterium]
MYGSSNEYRRRCRWEYVAVLAIVAVLAFGIILVLRRPDPESQETAMNMTDTTGASDETAPSGTAALTSADATAETAVNEQPEPSETPATEPTDPPTEPPESVEINVPYISQKGLLPTGCELVSALMLLQFYDCDVTIDEVVEATPSQYPVTKEGKACGPHPEDAFIGSPYDETSFGCFAPVITDMMNSFLPEDLKAKDISGMDLDEIAQKYLPEGKPVLVWGTINMMESFENLGWYLEDENGNPTDEWYDWRANEHCMVLVGYDETYYYVNDPYGSKGTVSYKRSLMEQRYEEIGGYAVVVE